MSLSIDAESLRLAVSAARHGDRAAADLLVRAHEPWVRSAVYAVTGRREDVDDIVQQVWIRAWERLATLNDPSQIRAWLYRIARHAAIDAGIARRRRQSRQTALDEDLHGDATTVRPAERTELHETLLNAVRALPATYREPFVLRHLNGWTYAEIAEVLGLSVEAVETRLVRARGLLRESLAGKV
jgi:RNA polymerase sigma-70 factor (ECF subfamily)